MTAVILAYAMGLLTELPPNQDEAKVAYVVSELQPALTPKDSQELAAAVVYQAKKNQLDWRLFVAILNQESSLKKNPQGCLVRREDCADYGVAQINFRTWGQQLHLDKRKLVTSYGYSVGTAARILASYKRQYSKRDPNWHGRYHSVNAEYKNEYLKRIDIHYGKIRKILGNFNYERQARNLQQNNGIYGRQANGFADGRDPRTLYFFDRPRRKVLSKV